MKSLISVFCVFEFVFMAYTAGDLHSMKVVQPNMKTDYIRAESVHEDRGCNINAASKLGSSMENKADVQDDSVPDEWNEFGGKIRPRIATLMGTDFIEPLLIADIGGLLYFQQKLGPVDETSGETFISRTTSLLESEIVAFVLDVCVVCGYCPSTPLFKDIKPSKDILARLQELEDLAVQKSGKGGKEACIVRRLQRFFRGEQAGRSRQSLLAAEDGPGLAILVWSLGRHSADERWLYPTLSFYCAGHLLKTTTAAAPGGAAADLYIVTTGVAEAALTAAAARRCARRAAVRLRVAEFALAARAPGAAFALRGFCFYRAGRPPPPAAASPTPPLPGGAAGGPMDMEYVLLPEWPDQDGPTEPP